MPNHLLQGQRRKVRMLITRIGDNVNILRPDGNATENQFGKVSDGDVTRTQVGTEWARRIYASGDQRPDMPFTEGGRRQDDNPRLAFPWDADVQEDDHIEFPNGDVYRVVTAFNLDTHEEFRVEDVT